jgi:hypothetical protein
MARLSKRQYSKRNKFGAIKVKTEDGTFDSKAEHARWLELKRLEKAGDIRDLDRQERFLLRAYTPLDIKGEPIGYYVADFVYYDKSDQMVVEDVKGVETALFKWKAKHMEAQYAVEIKVVKARRK